MCDSHCYLCRDHPPSFVCFCEEVRVCQTCISSHLLDSPSLAHKPVALHVRELTETFRSEERPIQKEAAREPDEKSSRRAQERALLLREIERLTCFRSETLLSLQNTCLMLERQVASTFEEISAAVTKQTADILEKLEQRLSDVEDLKSPSADKQAATPIADELLRLGVKTRDIDMRAIIRSSLDVQLELKDLTAAAKPRALYKLFGGSNNVGVFDVLTERHAKTLSTPVKFYHNSCFCESPAGLVFVTGGSITGKSQNEVFCLTPDTGDVKQLRAMHIARRSHASVFAMHRLYVFGGLLDEERLSLCECYRPESDSWELIAQMKERRAYLSCCEHKGKLYVAGGAQQSSCEVYDADRDAFRLITIDHTSVQDNCSMLSLADSILLFHGSFQGEVTKFDPATEKSSREKEMCVGNSWSSCAPVLVDKTVFLLRSDSVFKYDIGTGESAYVLRMAKVAKKRFTLEE